MTFLETEKKCLDEFINFPGRFIIPTDKKDHFIKQAAFLFHKQDDQLQSDCFVGYTVQNLNQRICMSLLLDVECRCYTYIDMLKHRILNISLCFD